MKGILTKILWGRQNPLQFLMAGLGFLAGMLIVLLSVQVWAELNNILEPVKAESGKGEYLIINKEITLANTMKLSSSAFSDAEIADLKKQAFVQKLGLFTANQFQSFASSGTTIPFSTVLFCEAVPDEFLDNKPENFEWQPGSNTFPLLLSQDFLNLYNFGFALSQGLPQLSRASIQMVPLHIEISGARGRFEMNGKITGFSDRFSTVLVPQSFMDWANKNIGNGVAAKPSRVILQVSNPSDPGIADYLESHSYQTNNDKLRMGKASGIIKAVMTLIGLLGTLFIALSFVIFTTNFRAVIAEAKDEIKLLLELGYTARSLAYNLLGRFAIYVLFLAIAAGALLYFGVSKLHDTMEKNGLEHLHGIQNQTLILGAVFVVLTLLVNIFSVLRLVNRVYK
ncbi:MAG: FtsX-like permease family protein [Bacteroidota bacterium]